MKKNIKAENLKEPEKKQEPSYEAKDIYVLEGLEPVRKRPGMYIGSTGIDGLHHLIWEVVDNSLDEAMAGYAKNIEVALLADNAVRVADDGRGIPVEIHKQTKKSALETVMTTLHAGGKFGGESYKISGGLHGVGVSVVNALSQKLKVEVCRKGERHAQEYARGKPKTKVQKIGACPLDQTGTTVTFSPDHEVFKEVKFDWHRILTHLREQAYLTKGVRIEIRDERKEPFLSHTFYFEGGIVSFIAYLNKAEKPLHQNIFYAEKEIDKIVVEAAIQYTEDLQAKEVSFANNIHTGEGGMHLTGFRIALTRTLNDYARKNGYVKESDENLTGEDVREGLTAIVSVKLREPQFEGQTKARLGNPEARAAVENAVSGAFEEFLEKNPTDAKLILEKCVLASKARLAAKAARETVLRKGALEGLMLPGKLADCSSDEPEKTELFIVEGDSAGGCFSGETKVALADGRAITFRELAEEDKKGIINYCYTVRNDGTVGIGKITNPRLTKKDTEVIKIVLDNDEEIVCTPDHKFMLSDGTFKETQYLTQNDSLMPLYRQYSRLGKRITIDGYEMVFDPGQQRWIFTHLLADKYNLESGIYFESDGSYRHHKDFNKLNNNPENVIRLRKATNDKSLLRYDTILTRFFGSDKRGLAAAVTHYNHKIKGNIKLNKRIDVYDLEVPGTHNFALASGVFVHNSAKQGRDRKFQAILPLRGKILNVERARLDKVLGFKEIRALIIALGTGVGEEFDVGRLRYHRVIIMTDADVDGSHIRTLLLTLLYRHLPELIQRGHIYIAEPPLYRIQHGKNVEYAYSDLEKGKVVALLKSKDVTPGIQRYKGLGEMNPDQLWETTMNPANRVMRKVTVADAEEADRIFDILMGEEVGHRKRFILTHATSVQNLDI